jgi:hypothetical protein
MFDKDPNLAVIRLSFLEVRGSTSCMCLSDQKGVAIIVGSHVSDQINEIHMRPGIEIWNGGKVDLLRRKAGEM